MASWIRKIVLENDETTLRQHQDWNQIFTFFENDKTALFEQLIRKDCDHSIKTLFEKCNNENFVYQQNSQRFTAFHLAIKYGATEIVKNVFLNNSEQYVDLFNLTVNVNELTAGPIHLAIIYKQFGILKDLLNNENFDVNEQNGLGQTVLEVALSRQDRLQILEIIVRRNDLNFHLSDETSAFNYAGINSTQVMKLLLSNKVALSNNESMLKTLQTAAKSANKACSELLLNEITDMHSRKNLSPIFGDEHEKIMEPQQWSAVYYDTAVGTLPVDDLTISGENGRTFHINILEISTSTAADDETLMSDENNDKSLNVVVVEKTTTANESTNDERARSLEIENQETTEIISHHCKTSTSNHVQSHDSVAVEENSTRIRRSIDAEKETEITEYPQTSDFSSQPHETSQVKCAQCSSPTNKVEIVLQPCWHLCLCVECRNVARYDNKYKCPKCFQRVRSYGKVRF